MNREPLITVASITAAVAAVIALVTAFGLDLTGDQQTAILGVVAVLAPIAVGIYTRPKVTPNGSVAAREDGAGVLVAGPAAAQEPGTHVSVRDTLEG